MEFCANPRSLR